MQHIFFGRFPNISEDGILHTNSYEAPPIADEKQQWESGQRNCGNLQLSIERVFMNGVEIELRFLIVCFIPICCFLNLIVKYCG